MIVAFEWLLPLTGFGFAESGADCHVFDVVVVVPSLVSVASWLAVIVMDV